MNPLFCDSAITFIIKYGLHTFVVCCYQVPPNLAMLDRKMDMVVTVPLLTLEYFEMDLKWQQIVVEECVNEA